MGPNYGALGSDGCSLLSLSTKKKWWSNE
jgi:hypothetical protein